MSGPDVNFFTNSSERAMHWWTVKKTNKGHSLIEASEQDLGLTTQDVHYLFSNGYLTEDIDYKDIDIRMLCVV